MSTGCQFPLPHQGNPAMKFTRLELLLVALIAAVTVAIVYGGFTHNYFVFDDFKYLENFSEGPLAVLLGYNSLRLVSNLSWWPLHAVAGFDPFLYNVWALMLHGANTVLLYLFVARFFRDRSYGALAGFLFLVNAVGCDAVFWKATSSSLINLFFYLITLNAYLLYREKNSRGYRLLSVGAFLLAIFSKEEAASLPFVILVIELLYFGGRDDIRGTVRRVVPYVTVILLYLAVSAVTFALLVHGEAEPAKFFEFRPLHSLFACWTVFFLPPQGIIRTADSANFITAAGMLLSFFWVRDKKILWFGYGWIFFAFLPQSLTALGQYDPRLICNSISRYLYITSIGSSLVIAALLVQLREKFSVRVFYPAALIFLALFASVNYDRIQERGYEWRDEGAPMELFLKAMKKVMPEFPPHSIVFVENKRAGRAFVQQGLRAYYRNPDITWLADPGSYIRRPEDNVFLIVCRLKNDGGIDVRVERI